MTQYTVSIDEATMEGKSFGAYLRNMRSEAIKVTRKRESAFERRFKNAAREALQIERELREDREAALKKYKTLDDLLEEVRNEQG